MSVASTSTKGSAIVGGAIEIDGHVFMKQKRCLLSGRKNTDMNPVKEGPYGRDNGNKFVIWNRGTSWNPEGSYDKISVLTWMHGGFADDYPDIRVFEQTLRDPKNQGVKKEFMAACSTMEGVIAKGRMRFVGSVKDQIQAKLLEARKVVLQQVTTSQCKVTVPHQGIEIAKFDRENPGVREKKGYKTTWLKVAGDQVKECVLIPKNEVGVYDVDLEQISASVMSETVDDGEAVISERQLQSKFKGLSQKNRDMVEAAAENKVLDENRLDDDLSLLKPSSDDEEEADTEPEDELVFARRLVMDVSLPSGASSSKDNKKQIQSPRSSCGASTHSRKSTKSSSVAAPTINSSVKSFSPVTPVKGKGVGISTSEGSQASLGAIAVPPDAVAASPGDVADVVSSPDPSVKSKGRPNKFAGMSCAEIMEQNDFDAKVKVPLEAGMASLTTDTFMLYQPNPDALAKAQPQSLKSCSEAHRNVVLIDNKFRKVSVPVDATALIREYRAKTQALQHFWQLFGGKGTKKANPEKLLDALEALLDSGIAAPPIAHAMYFAHLVDQLAHFGRLDEIAEMCDPSTGYFKFLEAEDQSKVSTLIFDVTATTLQVVEKGIEAEASEESSEVIRSLAKFAESMMSNVRSDVNAMQEDLKDLKKALEGDMTVTEKLNALKTSSSYSGVLKAMLCMGAWDNIIAQLKPAKDEEGLLVTKELMTSIEESNISAENAEAMRKNVVEKLLTAFQAAAGEDNKQVMSGIKRAYTGLLQRGRSYLSAFAENLKDMCKKFVENGDWQATHSISQDLCKKSRLEFEDVPSSFNAAASCVKQNEKLAEIVTELNTLAKGFGKLAELEQLLATAFDIKKTGADGEALVNSWGKVLEFVQMQKFDENLKLGESIAAVMPTMGIRDQGKTLFDSAVGHFKETLGKLAVVVTKSAPVDERELKNHTEPCHKALHALCQLACYANDRKFYDEVLHFHKECTIVLVSDFAFLESVTADATFYEEKKCISAACKMITSATSVLPLDFFLTDLDVKKNFLDKLVLHATAYEKARKKLDSEYLERATQEVRKLERAMIDESKGTIKVEMFSGLMKPADLSNIKELRIKAKDFIAKLSEEAKANAAGLGDVIEKGKYQCFKYGLAKFVTHAKIGMLSTDGEKLRSNLEEIWGLRKADEGFKEYLGKSDVSVVMEAIKGPEPPPAIAPKGAKRNRPEAASRSTKKRPKMD